VECFARAGNVSHAPGISTDNFLILVVVGGFGDFLLLETEEGSDRSAVISNGLLLIELLLILDGASGKGKGLEAGLGDQIARTLTNSIFTGIDPQESLFDFVKGVLFLGKDVECEIAIVGIAPGVGLVHPESRGISIFATNSIARHAGHLIDQRITQIEEALALRFEKGRRRLFRLLLGFGGRNNGGVIGEVGEQRSPLDG